MRKDKEFEMPFAVMRKIGTSMEMQLVNGFTRAIRNGQYKDGDELPGIRRLAALFDVSEITVRNAVRRLCRDGLLVARPRVGIRVCGVQSRSWRGSVLGLTAGPPGSFFVGVLEGSIARVLRRNGWLYSSVTHHAERGHLDLSALDMCLMPSMSLVLTFHAPFALSAGLEKKSVRFVAITPEKSSPRFPCILIDMSQVVAELAEDLKTAGVKDVLFVYQHPSVRDLMSAELESNGVKVRRLLVRPIADENTQESVQRAGLMMFERLIAQGKLRADAVVCNDDYLAAGILSAFDRAGVRLPEDLCFATLSNKGLGPVYVKELTRIEMDSERFGEEIGAAVSAYLDTGRISSTLKLQPRYWRGETIG